jgi:hypothetical protein
MRREKLDDKLLLKAETLVETINTTDKALISLFGKSHMMTGRERGDIEFIAKKYKELG